MKEQTTWSGNDTKKSVDEFFPKKWHFEFSMDLDVFAFGFGIGRKPFYATVLFGPWNFIVVYRWQ